MANIFAYLEKMLYLCRKIWSMKTDKKIGVVIATSMRRIDSLFSLSLQSVLDQTVSPDCIVVVDDNNDSDISQTIEKRINALDNPIVHYIKNKRTKNMSGTGAWNTGIDFLTERIGEDNYVAILDDDDSWDSDYIETLHQNIQDLPDAVFAYLYRSDCFKPSVFSREDLTIPNFLYGDPGIQGSNMCFKIKNLLSIGGFDEQLASCTDRDLMIRFLERFGNSHISIIPTKLINHFVGTNTVTANYETKRAGLNIFFRKHISRFDLPTLNRSLQRAERLFLFPDAEEILSLWKQNATVLITGVCGFIGSHVARTFVQRGYRVIGIDNLSTGVEDNITDFVASENFEYFNTSVNNQIEIEKIIEHHKPNYIFHFAALPRIRYSIDHPKESHIANVDATRILADLFSKSVYTKLFVFASSSSVYGQSGGEKMSEEAILNPLSPYAKQKAEAEKSLIERFSESNGNLVILRLFNVYGYSHQPINNYSTLIGKMMNGIYTTNSITIHGNGMQKRDFTYIDDVVSATVKCVEHYEAIHSSEIINIGTGNNYSVNNISDILQSYFQRRINRNFINLDFVEPDYTLADNQKAKQLLDWTQETDIHSGIDNLIHKTITNQEIVIGVAMHNNAPTIRRCLLSVLNQRGLKRQLKVVLANDKSSDNWQNELEDLLQDPRIKLIHLCNNNTVQTRNAIHRFIIENMPRCILVGRLDADDEYSSKNELAKIESLFDRENPDVISAGNYLRENGTIIRRTNHTTSKLADKDYLLSRLKQMADCVPESELPSCNLFIRPCKLEPYPTVESGEDHALFVYYLLNSDKYKISFAEELLPVIYDLGGNVTSNNRFSGKYARCRKELFTKTLELCTAKKE